MELNQIRYMNSQQQELLSEAYENWCKQFEVDPNNFDGEELAKGHGDQCWGYPILEHVKPTTKEYKRGQINAYLEGKAEKPFFYLTKEEFINKCKTDSEFSERWGLKIEERELSWEERYDLYEENYMFTETIEERGIDYKYKIPTKLITITYQDKTIESYDRNR